jgi:hypothetical protein
VKIDENAKILTVNQRVAGSSPAGGAQQDRRSFSISFFFVDLPKTLLALRSTRMGVVKGVVATFPFSKTSFSEKMQPSIFFLTAPFDFL